MTAGFAALLTDFGVQDHYVGVMKAVILSAAPGTQIIDLTHQIPPQDIRSGAFELRAAYSYFPLGTVFVCVVDPGVGSSRRILCAEVGRWLFLAPDNGLLSWTLEREPARGLWDISKAVLGGPVSQTFHGRDIFAPVAARLLNGEAPSSLGASVSDPQKLPFPKVQKLGNQWKGEVLAADIYGNLVTNFRSDEIAPLAKTSTVWFEWASQKATLRGLASSYSSVEPGKLLAIGGSSEFVEIAVREGSAVGQTGLKPGDPLNAVFRT